MALALIVNFLSEISTDSRRALCPISKSISGRTGTKRPKTGCRETSRPGKVTTWPRLARLTPERTSNGICPPKVVPASPEQATLPFCCYKEGSRW